MFNSYYNYLRYLTFGKTRINFRNNQGKALAHRGGGHKRSFLIVDYKQPIWHLRGFIISIFYDPNRTAKLALVSYSNGVISYVLAPSGVSPGSFFYSGFDSPISSIGSRFYL